MGRSFPNHFRTHFVYLIPSDKTNTTEMSIHAAALHLQAWYRNQMGNRKTFELCDPIVEVRDTNHPSSWYSSNVVYNDFTHQPAPHNQWYWANVQTDARDLAGAGFYQTFDNWVIYVDADPDPDQYAGGASTGVNGLCVLGAKDCASLRGEDPDWPICRGIGGGGHELGHTFGRPHPPPPPNPDWVRGIMGIGYLTYPDDILTEDDKSALNVNPFFKESVKRNLPERLCPFDDTRPRPQPRPRPTPKPRDLGHGQPPPPPPVPPGGTPPPTDPPPSSSPPPGGTTTPPPALSSTRPTPAPRPR